MAIDQSKIGAVAAQLMDIVEEAHGEAEAEVSAVMLIVAVDRGEGGDTLHYAVSDGLAKHVGRGMLLEVQEAIAGS